MKRTLILVLALAGCAVGPDYHKPDAPVPTQFKELEGWRQAAPGDAAPRGPWWTLFDDAELDGLMKRVDVSNQTIIAADARFRQARAVVDQARAGLFPTVSANTSATRTKSPSLPNAPSFATGAVNNFNASLNASWELDLWGRVRRSVEAGEASWEGSSADLEAARLSARASLAQAYFSLRVADAARRVLDETVASYQRTVELTQNRYNAGVAARVDIVQAQVQLRSAQASLLDVGVQRAQFEHAIALLVGVPPAQFSIAPVTADLKIPSLPVVVPSELLQRRPDIAAAERAMAAANAQIGVATAAYYPSLTLTGAAGSRTTQLTDLLTAPTRFWSLGAAAAETLFDGGLRRAVTEQARAAYDAQVATYRQTVLTGFQEVEDNLAALRILDEEAAIQQDVVDGARHALELTENQYRAGVVGYLNVIAAQQVLFNSQRSEFDILGRRLTAAVALVRAMGGGWTTEELAKR
jgi:NodT family efflux transporter outer membrane factor (OMF) lipoprotein